MGAQTLTFLNLNHSEMELEQDVVGKVIRVYWTKDKGCFTGKIFEFNVECTEHLIKYKDGDEYFGLWLTFPILP